MRRCSPRCSGSSGSASTTTSSTSAATRCWRRGWSAGSARPSASSSRSAACSRRRPWRRWRERLGDGAGGAAGAASPWRGRSEIPLSFAQRRLWFLDRLEGPSATYNIPLALRLTGALDVAALEAALGDVVARHESLRTVFPDTRRRAVPADPATPLGGAAEARGDAGHRGGPRRTRWRAAARRTASIWRASCRCGRMLFALGAGRARAAAAAASHRRRRLVAGAAGARPGARPTRRGAQGGRPTWPPLPVQYADYTLWQRELLGDESDPDSRDRAPAGVLDRDARRAARRSSTLPTDRPRPAVPSYRGGTRAAVDSTPSCTAACWRWRARAARACSWCCRRRLRRC